MRLWMLLTMYLQPIVQPSNAQEPISVTLAGITTEVRELQPLNVTSPSAARQV